MGSLGRLHQLMVCWKEGEKEGRQINVQCLLVMRLLADVTLRKTGWNERAVYPTPVYIMPSLPMEGHAQLSVMPYLQMHLVS